ncbi:MULTISPECIES: cytochrome P450 [unclassified Streptomyces]|uniref:cytochrome P450 n=1 Tax=unclassified Streptomyces TaxID=2593676 RepID=UPI0022B7224E|nr:MULTISPECIES: cytochrome P450 [unclassified Streptomyces]MCZ7416012.1 cytochrome P450 [Streptomyces sp. WMMC897]MCZ7434181.1 cytochrome P450 [Streptomyces sp. WMMC1477]
MTELDEAAPASEGVDDVSSVPRSAADGSPPVDSFNPADPALHADPYPAYRTLRDRYPVMRGPLGVFLVSRYEDCETLLRDRRMGKDFANSKFFQQIMGDAGDEPPPFLGLGLDDWDAKLFMLTDPPEHTRLRALVSQAFTPATVTALNDAVTGIVDDLLSGVPDRFDLMERLAAPMPIRVLSTMLAIPAEDEHRFTAWSAEIAGLLDLDVALPPEAAEARRTAVAECTGYFVELAQRRGDSRDDDLISRLVRARDEEGALTTQEIAATCVLLVVAAQETFSNLLGNAVILLSRHPEVFSRLAEEPAVMDRVLEEILRLEPPAHQVGRIALERIELHGQVIEPGDAVILLVASANRDERVISDPDVFDIDREDRTHLSFGRGIHYCLGAPLATMMAKEAFIGLTKRFSSVRRTEETVTYKPGMGLRGPAALPVAVRKRGPQ